MRVDFRLATVKTVHHQDLVVQISIQLGSRRFPDSLYPYLATRVTLHQDLLLELSLQQPGVGSTNFPDWTRGELLTLAPDGVLVGE